MNDRFRILGRVAAGVAHDLNNYLGVVDLSLAMLDRRAVKADRGHDVATAREALEQALRLTHCLVEYARGSAPAPAPVDLAVLVRRVLSVFRRVIPDGVKVVVDAATGSPTITGVAPELEQLILNLVLNACDAMPCGGTLELAVRATESGMALEVADTGSGLPPAVGAADAALTPSTKAGRDGGGLGLGIVRCVAERHGATLQLAPRRGGGTAVTVAFLGHVDGGDRTRGELPAAADQGRGTATSQVRREVLLVDDDADTRTCFCDLLVSMGFLVHTAENGRAALQLLDGLSRPPSCIILDLEMPVMNGWEFMDRLRRNGGVPPVVVVSGAANPPAGATCYFSKPPPLDALLRAVASCCGSA